MIMAVRGIDDDQVALGGREREHVQRCLEERPAVLLAVAVLALVSISRAYTVRLQNRIIRLEKIGRAHV